MRLTADWSSLTAKSVTQKCVGVSGLLLVFSTVDVTGFGRVYSLHRPVLHRRSRSNLWRFSETEDKR